MEELNGEFTKLKDKMTKTEELYEQLLQKSCKEESLKLENQNLKSENK